MMIGDRIKASESKSTVMLGALVLIAAIAVYNWAVAPHWNYLQAAERYESTREKLSVKGKSLRTAVAAQRVELQELERRRSQIEGMLFSPVEATTFLNGVQSVAEDTGCVTRSLTFLSVSPDAESGRLAERAGTVVRCASLSVLGGYGEIVELVERLQNRPQQVSIDSLSLRIGEAHPGKLDCNMTIVIWVLPQPEEGFND